MIHGQLSGPACFLALACVLSLVPACGSSLSEAGSSVTYGMQETPPAGCELIEMVEQSGPGFEAPHSQGELITILRNHAGELGANYVVIDTVDERTGASGRIYLERTGRAMRCP